MSSEINKLEKKIKEKLLEPDLEGLLHECSALSNQMLSARYICVKESYCWGKDLGAVYEIRENMLIRTYLTPEGIDKKLLVASLDNNLTLKLLWFDSSGEGWNADIVLKTSSPAAQALGSFPITGAENFMWLGANRLLPVMPELSSDVLNSFTEWSVMYNKLNSNDEINALLLSKDPEAYFYAKEKRKDCSSPLFSSASLLMAPQIRLLDEWGYACIRDLTKGPAPDDKDFYETFNYYFSSGNTPEEVIHLSPEERERYRDENLAFWPLDNLRA